MSLTPNYSFIIPTGSDAVNLLTQCYPNFTSLDSILKPIQESGVTVATDTKVGTVHQLVRTDSSCNMFRFIATGNYASGDTFTVDGASVTATAMDGTALSAGAFVINQSVVCVLNNLVLTVLVSGKETTSLPASAVTYDNTGSGLTATNAQDAIDEVVTMIPSVPEHGVYELWLNPSPSTTFAAQDVTVTNDNSFDMFFIDFIRTSDGYIRALGTGETGKLSTVGSFALSSTAIVQDARNFTISKTGNVYTFSFQDEKTRSSAYGSGTYTDSVNNDQMVPYRIVGVLHNN